MQLTQTCYNSNFIRKRVWLHLREKLLNHNLWYNITSNKCFLQHSIGRHHTSIKCSLKLFIHVFFFMETEMHNLFNELFNELIQWSWIKCLVLRKKCCYQTLFVYLYLIYWLHWPIYWTHRDVIATLLIMCGREITDFQESGIIRDYKKGNYF